MRDKVKQLITEDLDHNNLVELISLCDKLFDSYPIIYGTLSYIFRSLEEEYEDQAVPGQRYMEVKVAIQKPLLDLLQNETSSPEMILKHLNNVMKSFRNIK